MTSLAFYGDEKLGVGDLFKEDETKLAISYAESAALMCSVVRQRVYDRAPT